MEWDIVWKRIAYGYFISTTLGLVILFEFLVFGAPYITGFIVLFIFILGLNIKFFAPPQLKERLFKKLL